MEKNVQSAMLESMNMVFALVDQAEINFSNYWYKKSLKISFSTYIF